MKVFTTKYEKFYEFENKLNETQNQLEFKIFEI
jgi:hypothetical protein